MTRHERITALLGVAAMKMSSLIWIMYLELSILEQKLTKELTSNGNGSGNALGSSPFTENELIDFDHLHTLLARV